VVEFSADGRLGAVAHGKGVAVADCGEGWAVRHNLPETDVAALSFSPRGSFLLTLARLPSARVGQPTPVPEKGNLCVWDTRSGHLLAHFLHKKSALDAWYIHTRPAPPRHASAPRLLPRALSPSRTHPPTGPSARPVIRWSEDEEIAAKMVTNEIQFFFGSNFVRPPPPLTRSTSRRHMPIIVLWCDAVASSLLLLLLLLLLLSISLSLSRVACGVWRVARGAWRVACGVGVPLLLLLLVGWWCFEVRSSPHVRPWWCRVLLLLRRRRLLTRTK
jgi:hypothetical protein